MTITFEDVARTVREVVAEMPNFVYREFRAKQLNKPIKSEFPASDEVSCVYYDEDGEPSCIFGMAFHRLGLEIPEKVISDGIDTVLEELGIEKDSQQIRWAETIQSYQDRYLWSWSTVLEHADEDYLL